MILMVGSLLIIMEQCQYFSSFCLALCIPKLSRVSQFSFFLPLLHFYALLGSLHALNITHQSGACKVKRFTADGKTTVVPIRDQYCFSFHFTNYSSTPPTKSAPSTLFTDHSRTKLWGH